MNNSHVWKNHMCEQHDNTLLTDSPYYHSYPGWLRGLVSDETVNYIFYILVVILCKYIRAYYEYRVIMFVLSVKLKTDLGRVTVTDVYKYKNPF